ncbi:unnamed protein product [Acanthoscelides obtectus]|uniref:Uncharacterized protein n=1 Tax=Acanthoscelides obtectus TaxID=200917 RepID=A0A9P0PBI9_ACAOB|nr:unnamed protein product [Acanthoscelides obtectus]CAK1655692.1 hypothetical protein AOBTE_LOCUS19265 [Acanthoscelides obtectus]
MLFYRGHFFSLRWRLSPGSKVLHLDFSSFKSSIDNLHETKQATQKYNR